MDFSNVTKTIRQTGRYVGIKIWKYSPTILAIGGTASIITAGVMACKATLKLDDTLKKVNDDISQVRENHEIALKETDVENSDEYLEKFYRKELVRSYANAGWAMTKLYGPSVLMCAAGVVCIFGSKKIMDDRYSSLLAACTTTERLFADYRKRVKEDLGDEADQKYRFGLKTEEIEVPELNKKGEPKLNKDGTAKTKKEKKTILLRDIPDSDFARVFEECTSREWDNNFEVNELSLLQKQTWANHLLKSRGYLFLNEVYDMLGFPVTPAGQDVGWIFVKDNPNGDNVVDFGLYKAYKPGSKTTRLEAMSNENNAIVLDFNIDGYIKDKLFEAQYIYD